MLVAATSLLMLLLTAYWAVKEGGKHRVTTSSKSFWLLGHPYSKADAVVTPLVTGFVILFSATLLNDRYRQIHLQSVSLLVGAITFSQLVRVIAVRSGKFRQFAPSYLNIAHVALLQAVGTVYIYASAFTASRLAHAAAWLMIFGNAVAIVKFRAYDDFDAGSVQGESVPLGTVYLVMAFDIIWRSIVAIALTFALACLLLVNSPAVGAALTDVGAFKIASPSENLFFDFVYYAVATLTTVGYGDVTPVSAPARIIASVFMLTGYVLFAMIIGLAVSITSEIRRDHGNAR